MLKRAHKVLYSMTLLLCPCNNPNGQMYARNGINNCTVAVVPRTHRPNKPGLSSDPAVEQSPL